MKISKITAAIVLLMASFSLSGCLRGPVAEAAIDASVFPGGIYFDSGLGQQ